MRYVEPMGTPRDAALDTARSGRSVSDGIVCDELLESPTPPKWASDIDTPCGIPRATATPVRGYETGLNTTKVALIRNQPIGLEVLIGCNSIANQAEGT